jgi:APA family basic amino acid/polyamine antiporter
VAPILFITMCGVIALLILLHNPLPALVGVGIVICGLPIHHYLTARQSSAALTSEGN